jgi:ParB/RepB/Spo0J family partition protein
MPEMMLSIPLAKLKPSPSNPRKHFDDSKTAELAASIGKVGVLEPIIVRAWKKTADYEIVCGERRYRAAKLAKLDDVPSVLREYSDDDVLEIQITENSQRENPHPLDEADGFKALVDRGRTPASIADKIGRPTKYVLERLQLCELSPACRKALDEEKISLGAAMVLARVPGAKMQEKALQAAMPGYGGGIMPAKRVGEMVRERFMLKLAGAPFDRSDAKLVAKAGACTVCPKRTGNQTELFDDVKSPDVCTDPACYRSKLDAQWKLTIVAAKQSGQKVLSEKETKKLFPYSSDEPGYGSTFVDLNGHISHPKTHKQVAVKKLVTKDTAITLARGPNSGRIIELVSRATVQAALSRGAKKSKATPTAAADRKAAAKMNAAEKARREREKAKADAHDAVLMGLMEEAAGVGGQLGRTSTGFLVHLLEHLLEDRGDALHLFALRRKLVNKEPRGHMQSLKLERAILKDAEGESPAWIWSAITELLVAELGSMTFGQHPKRFAALLDELDIDRKAVETRVLKELAAKKVPASEDAPAPKKKAAAKKATAKKTTKKRKAKS